MSIFLSKIDMSHKRVDSFDISLDLPREQKAGQMLRFKQFDRRGFQKTPPPAPTPHPCDRCSTASPGMFHATAPTGQTTPRLGTRSDPRFANLRGTDRTVPAPSGEVRERRFN